MLLIVVVVIVVVVVVVKMQSGKIQTGFPEPSYRPFRFANSQLLFRQTDSCHAISCAKVDKSDYSTNTTMLHMRQWLPSSGGRTTNNYLFVNWDRRYFNIEKVSLWIKLNLFSLIHS